MNKEFLYTTKLESGGYELFYKNGIKLGDILCKENGFYDFWPELLNGGFWESYVLKEIADRLDALNKDWSDEIDKYFEEQKRNEVVG